MSEVHVLAEDVRAFQVVPNWLIPEIRISFYGGPSNACGSIRYPYESFDQVDVANQVALAWLAEDTPLRVTEDADGENSIRPMSNA